MNKPMKNNDTLLADLRGMINETLLYWNRGAEIPEVFASKEAVYFGLRKYVRYDIKKGTAS